MRVNNSALSSKYLEMGITAKGSSFLGERGLYDNAESANSSVLAYCGSLVS